MQVNSYEKSIKKNGNGEASLDHNIYELTRSGGLHWQLKVIYLISCYCVHVVNIIDISFQNS